MLLLYVNEISLDSVRLATPNLSGRDTPSSHISLDSSDRRTTSTHNAHTQESVSSNQTTATNTLQNPLMGSVQRGPILPVVVQKPFREDVPDKFNLFDLPQQRPTLEAGRNRKRIETSSRSLVGDETRSTISDNWSTMNAGVSEIDGQEQAAARLNEIVEELPIVEPRGRNNIVLPESNSMVSVWDEHEYEHEQAGIFRPWTITTNRSINSRTVGVQKRSLVTAKLTVRMGQICNAWSVSIIRHRPSSPVIPSVSTTFVPRRSSSFPYSRGLFIDRLPFIESAWNINCTIIKVIPSKFTLSTIYSLFVDWLIQSISCWWNHRWRVYHRYWSFDPFTLSHVFVRLGIW